MFNFKNLKSKISTSLAISLVIHSIFVSVFLKNQISNKPYILNSSNIKKIDLMSLKNVQIISKAKLDQLKKQIVENEKTGKKIKPFKSRFASEVDQQFDRQTIAKNIGAFKEAGAGSSASQRVASISPLKSKKAENHIKKTELNLSNIGTFTYNPPTESDVKKIENDLEKDKKGTKKENLNSGIQNGKMGISGLASNNDFVEEIPLGDVTNLNTTENKYFGFYHRIRQKLEQHWGSSIQDRAKKLYKSGRRLPASENLITAITVVLSDKGDILDIKIEGTSGVRELDQAAVESFNKAGPFPNPPKGLLVDGRAVIQWGFVVKS